jgi:hypothetical protein
MVAEARTGLHWWTFTSGQSQEAVCDRLGGSFSQVEGIGGYGHPYSICHESGARVYFGSPRDDQPVCVNVPGEVCDSWSGEAVTWAQDLAGVVTRADVALDLDPPEKARGRMIEMRRAWRAGKVETSIKKFAEHRSEKPEGWTWYFGGKSSYLRMRGYDRRGPLRLEFQLRPEKQTGEHLPEIIARRGVSSVWRSLAHSIRFPMRWYENLLVGDVAKLPETVREESLLEKVIDQLQLQLGASVWALQQLGVTLDDLSTPPEQIRGDVAAKFLRWADEAKGVGYDGEKLRREVRCRLKSRQNSVT